MSGLSTPTTPSPSPTPPHELAVAQKLPPDVLALVSKHLTLDTSEHRHDTFEDRRRDARSFARVCKAWQAAGTAAAWREVELLDYTSKPVVKHLEAHPKLYKHVEPFAVDLQHLLHWHDGVASPVFITSCPRLSRLELHGRYQPGPEFKVLQDKVDLSKLIEVVLIFYTPYTWYTRSGAVDRVVSPALLFAFLRACINVRQFTYDGDQACINEAVEAPRGRRIKVTRSRSTSQTRTPTWSPTAALRTCAAGSSSSSTSRASSSSRRTSTWATTTSSSRSGAWSTSRRFASSTTTSSTSPPSTRSASSSSASSSCATSMCRPRPKPSARRARPSSRPSSASSTPSRPRSSASPSRCRSLSPSPRRSSRSATASSTSSRASTTRSTSGPRRARCTGARGSNTSTSRLTTWASSRRRERARACESAEQGRLLLGSGAS